MDNEIENLDSTNETVEETVETPESAETTEETPEVDVEQLQATNKKLYERAKKAEADLKVLKSAEAKPASPQNVEETVLLAQGLPEELLGELKVISQLRKVSLIKGQADPIFVAIKEKFEKDKKREDASLPASRGSGSIKPKKDFSTPGLTREEHKEMTKAAS